VSAAAFDTLSLKSLKQLYVNGNHWSDADMRRISNKFHGARVIAQLQKRGDKNLEHLADTMFDITEQSSAQK
jgi:hypothetical protein